MPTIEIDASTDLDEMEANIELAQTHVDKNVDAFDDWIAEAVNTELNRHRQAIAAERLRRSK